MKKNIRLKIDTGRTGSAPQQAIDSATLAPVAVWRGEAVDVDVGLFDDATTPETMTNVTLMTLDISATADHAAPIQSIPATVANGRLDLTVTDGDWTAGTAQHARFPIAKGALTLAMDGAETRTLYLRITAIESGEWIVLAQGACSIHEAGAWPV
jgi:hypothetical protein